MSDHVSCVHCARRYLPRNVHASDRGPVCLICLGVDPTQPATASASADAIFRLVFAAAGDLPPDASPFDHVVQIAVRRILGNSSARDSLARLVATAPRQGGEAA